MALNPSIILAGQQPDFLGTIDRANSAAARSTEMTRQNKLNQLYQTQGAGIMAGDQNALNALAQYDPQAAMGVQQTYRDNRIQDSEIERRNMVQDRDFDMKLKAYKQQVGAEQAAAEAQQIEQGIVRATQLYQSGDLQGVNALLQSVGEQPLSSLEEFPAVASMYKRAAETLKTFDDLTAAPEPADEYGRYVQEQRAAGQEPLSRIDYAQAKKGSETIYGPDGQVIVQRGAGGPPKLTVDAAKNTGFLVRTREANEVLNSIEGQGTRFGQQALENVPMGLGNYGRDPEFQKFDQARRDFVNAILRRESGAVISDQEFENANQQYFPVPGDSPEVIAQKRRNRETTIQGLEIGSGDGAAYVNSQQPAAPAQPAQEAAPDQREPIPDFSAMTDEELDAYIAEKGGAQ